MTRADKGMISILQMEKSKVYLYLCEWETDYKGMLSLHKRRVQVISLPRYSI